MMKSNSKSVIPDALQRETLLRRSGISRVEGDPGPAARHCMPRSIRDSAKRLVAGFAMLALTACSAEPGPRIYDRDPSLPENLPFSSAVVVGDMVFLAGEIGRKPGTVELVEGGVGPETEAIFENYKATLARVGASLVDIVKCTVFLDDMSKFDEMNAAYAEVFPNEKPARSTFGVDGLAMGAALEIECLAVKR